MAVEKATLLAMIAAAKDMRERAYAPYSGFRVGAVVMGGSGRQFHTGCNVENASYGLTICAERAAICRAISEGEKTISAVVIVGGEKTPARPCGACLQVMAEFAPHDEPLVIVTAAEDMSYDVHTLEEYLPMHFHLEF